MKIGSRKGIIDVELNRHTLETPSNQLPWFGGSASSKSTIRVSKTLPNGSRLDISFLKNTFFAEFPSGKTFQNECKQMLSFEAKWGSQDDAKMESETIMF